MTSADGRRLRGKARGAWPAPPGDLLHCNIFRAGPAGKRSLHLNLAARDAHAQPRLRPEDEDLLVPSAAAHLMGPGPSEIHPRVFTAMSQPAIGYLDPVFVEMMEELKSLLRYAFQTKNPLTFPVSGPGSVGMEILLRQHGQPRRQGDRVPQRRVRRPHDRERRALRRRRRSSSRTRGASRSIRKRSRTR